MTCFGNCSMFVHLSFMQGFMFALLPRSPFACTLHYCTARFQPSKLKLEAYISHYDVERMQLSRVHCRLHADAFDLSTFHFQCKFISRYEQSAACRIHKVLNILHVLRAQYPQHEPTFKCEFLSGYEQSAAGDATEAVYVEHFIPRAHHEITPREPQTTFRAFRTVQSVVNIG